MTFSQALAKKCIQLNLPYLPLSPFLFLYLDCHSGFPSLLRAAHRTAVGFAARQTEPSDVGFSK